MYNHTLKQSIFTLSVGLPAKKNDKKRAAKKDAKKARARKEKRLQNCIDRITKLLKAPTVDLPDGFFKSIHKRYDKAALKVMIANHTFIGEAGHEVNSFIDSITDTDTDSDE